MSTEERTRTYRDLHRPSKEFVTRDRYLERELQIMDPRRWRLNLPRRDYNFEVEDLVPAISGTIGKVVMTTAIVGAFADAFGLTPEFVVENVRFEMLIATALLAIPVCGFLNPRVNLAGCHGPMIPLIGMVVLAGGHPLALGVLVAVLGFLLGFTRGGARLIDLTGVGVRGGLLIILGLTGVLAQVSALRRWAAGIDMELISFVVIAVTVVVYAYLVRIKRRWLAIPLCSAVALVIALAMGAPFRFTTSPGIPNLNPLYWWGADTGWLLGLPDAGHFIAVLPFAVLAVAMWPPDFLSHKIFQETNFPRGSEKVLMDVDDTMMFCSVRQAVGSILGGGNLTSSWGTYMIPASIAKRPIPAGAILTGVGCILAALIGYPMDLAVFPPVLKVALLVGVFLPLLGAGMAMIQSLKDAEVAGTVVFSSVLVNPVFGWALTMVLDNIGMFDPERAESLRPVDRFVIPGLTLIVLTSVMAVTGMIPGIPALL